MHDLTTVVAELQRARLYPLVDCLRRLGSYKADDGVYAGYADLLPSLQLTMKENGGGASVLGNFSSGVKFVFVELCVCVFSSMCLQ